MNDDDSAESFIARSEQARAEGEHRLGAALAERAVQLASGDAALRARALALLALHEVRLGDTEAAVRAGQAALQHFVAGGDLLAQSQVHCTLALAYVDAEMAQSGLRHAVEALETARACGNQRAECWALNRLGTAYETMGEWDRSLEFGREGLALARALDLPEECFAALNNLANQGVVYARVLRESGRPSHAVAQAALADATQALAAARAAANLHREAVSRSNLGSALTELGRYDEAAGHFHTSHALAVEHGFDGMTLITDVDIARNLQFAGDTAQAIARLEATLAGLNAEGEPAVAKDVHEMLYVMHKQAGRTGLALEHLEKFHAFDVRERTQRADLQSRMLMNRLELDQARHSAERARLEAEMLRLRAEDLDHAAHHDALTGLLNRRFVDAQLPQLLARAGHRGTPLAAALIDIDHFKRVNDRHGHAVGDRVLAQVATLLRQTVRASDLAARIGGEEFLVLYVDAGQDQARDSGERLRATVQAYPWADIAPGLAVTISIGLAVATPGEAPDDWLARADRALYAAKHAGRNRVERAEG